MSLFKAQSLIARPAHMQYSEHSRQIIQLRHYFSKAIFLVPGKDSQYYAFKFVYASQKPFSLQLLCLEFMEVDLVEPVPHPSIIREFALQDITYGFNIKPGWKFTNADVLGCADVGQILVLQTSVHTAAGWISRDYAENLAFVLEALLPELHRRVRKTGTGSAAATSRKRTIHNDEEGAEDESQQSAGSDVEGAAAQLPYYTTPDTTKRRDRFCRIVTEHSRTYGARLRKRERC
eukprot:6492667-Amphidinium_carterae.1